MVPKFKNPFFTLKNFCAFKGEGGISILLKSFQHSQLLKSVTNQKVPKFKNPFFTLKEFLCVQGGGISILLIKFPT